MIVSVVLLDVEIWPLDPISNGTLLQLYPASWISSASDVYLSFFLSCAVSKFDSKLTVSSSNQTVFSASFMMTRSGLDAVMAI